MADWKDKRIADIPKPRFSLPTEPKIPHYWGDFVRQFFVAAAVVSVVVLPVWGDILPFGHLVQIAGILLLVLLAGITNPKSEMILIYDAAVSGIGVLLVEATAINYYHYDSYILFLAREVVSVLLLFAFYFSVKTIRAMSMHQLGKTDAEEEREIHDSNR